MAEVSSEMWTEIVSNLKSIKSADNQGEIADQKKEKSTVNKAEDFKVTLTALEKRRYQNISYAMMDSHVDFEKRIDNSVKMKERMYVKPFSIDKQIEDEEKNDEDKPEKRGSSWKTRVIKILMIFGLSYASFKEWIDKNLPDIINGFLDGLEEIAKISETVFQYVKNINVELPSFDNLINLEEIKKCFSLIGEYMSQILIEIPKEVGNKLADAFKEINQSIGNILSFFKQDQQKRLYDSLSQSSPYENILERGEKALDKQKKGIRLTPAELMDLSNYYDTLNQRQYIGYSFEKQNQKEFIDILHNEKYNEIFYVGTKRERSKAGNIIDNLGQQYVQELNTDEFASVISSVQELLKKYGVSSLEELKKKYSSNGKYISILRDELLNKNKDNQILKRFLSSFVEFDTSVSSRLFSSQKNKNIDYEYDKFASMITNYQKNIANKNKYAEESVKLQKKLEDEAVERQKNDEALNQKLKEDSSRLLNEVFKQKELVVFDKAKDLKNIVLKFKAESFARLNMTDFNKDRKEIQNSFLKFFSLFIKDQELDNSYVKQENVESKKTVRVQNTVEKFENDQQLSIQQRVDEQEISSFNNSLSKLNSSAVGEKKLQNEADEQNVFVGLKTQFSNTLTKFTEKIQNIKKNNKKSTVFYNSMTPSAKNGMLIKDDTLASDSLFISRRSVS